MNWTIFIENMHMRKKPWNAIEKSITQQELDKSIWNFQETFSNGSLIYHEMFRRKYLIEQKLHIDEHRELVKTLESLSLKQTSSSLD